MDELLRQLTDLFHRLRRAGMPLGLDELMSLQRALHHGFGFADQAALKRLCRLIWLVSPTDQALFDYHFNQAVTLTWPLPPTVPETPEVGGVTTGAESTYVTESAAAASSSLPSPVTTQPTDKRPTASPVEPELTPEQSLPLRGFAPNFMPEEGAEMARQVEDIHVQAQIVLAQTSGAEALLTSSDPAMRDFLPIAQRELQQRWRSLRRMVRSGPLTELDEERTVRQAAREGYLVKPVLRARRTNQSALLLLLDQKGSMIPFHFLCRALAETATAAGSFGQVGVYHFHNTAPPAATTETEPGGGHYREHLLYTTPFCVETQAVSAIMGEFKAVRPDVLIFSDAGAARKSWNGPRIEETALLLFQLQALGAEQFVWLNPLPQSRWPKTSAAAIAKFIPMFPLDHSGFGQAVQILNSGSRYTLNF